MTYKTIGQRDLKKLNWWGFKPLLKAPFYFRPFNRFVLFILGFLPKTRYTNAVPVMKPMVKYTMQSGATLQMLEPYACDVALDIFWGKGQRRSPADRYVMKSLEYFCTESKIFLDIGAYSGLFALVAAKANKNIKVYAYEILPQNYSLLVNNVIANDLIEQVTPRLLGLGSEKSSITMPLKTGLTRLPSSLSLGSSFTDGVSIPVNTLDSEARDLEVEGACTIKIDVEGFELEVLLGGQEYLTRIKPNIICEILLSTENYAEIEAVLKPLGYTFCLYTDDGLIKKDKIIPTSLGRDWLFTIHENIPGFRD